MNFYTKSNFQSEHTYTASVILSKTVTYSLAQIHPYWIRENWLKTIVAYYIIKVPCEVC